MSERIEAFGDSPDEVRGQRPAQPPDGTVALVDKPDHEEVPDMPRPLRLHKDGGLVIHEQVPHGLVDRLVLVHDLLRVIEYDVDLAAVLHAVHGLPLDGQYSLQPPSGLGRALLVELRECLDAAECDPYLGQPSDLVTTSFCRPL